MSHKRDVRPQSKHIDPDIWNLPRKESFAHQDDVEYWPPGALRFVQRQLVQQQLQEREKLKQNQQQQLQNTVKAT